MCKQIKQCLGNQPALVCRLPPTVHDPSLILTQFVCCWRPCDSAELMKLQ